MTNVTPRVELICVGSELLAGKSSVHGPYLAVRLAALGLGLDRETTVGDDPREMREAFRDAWRRAGIVITTGGLGPTFDDITRDVWSHVLRRPLKYFPHILEGIKEKFRRRGLRMPRENRRQAYVLSGACPLDNPQGTAPGQLLSAHGKILALLPGPRRELAPMVEGDFVPFLQKVIRAVPRLSRTWRIFGLSESAVDEKLDRIRRMEKSGKGDEVTWGILAQTYVIDIKVTVTGGTPERTRDRLERINGRIRGVFGRDIFGRDSDTLEEVVGRLFRARRSTLATAESCTGGLLAERITRVPGSSDYFQQGYVVYSNESKRRRLGVRPGTLKRHGAVSEACAREMARGCRKRAGTTWAAAITGIAGPTGGTPGKPVGLVYIALAGPRGVRCGRYIFSGERQHIRERSALQALDWLRRRVL